MKLLYIAGPYDDPDPHHGVLDNITKASRIALEYWRASGSDGMTGICKTSGE